MQHELKTWPEYYQKIITGEKRFEFRYNDRNFQVGDTLLLKEWDNTTKYYNGREVEVKVTYIFKPDPNAAELNGILDSYCIMSISLIHPPPITTEEAGRVFERNADSLLAYNKGIGMNKETFCDVIEVLLSSYQLISKK